MKGSGYLHALVVLAGIFLALNNVSMLQNMHQAAEKLVKSPRLNEYLVKNRFLEPIFVDERSVEDQPEGSMLMWGT